MQFQRRCTTLSWLFLLSSLLPTATVVVSAIKVSSPAKDSEWTTTSNSQSVSFESVSTDPDSVDIVLVNQHVYPTVSVVLGKNVATSSGTFAVPADKLTAVGGGDGYQINLVSTSNDGILAQSGTFTIDHASSSSSEGQEAGDAQVVKSSSSSSDVTKVTAGAAAVTTTASHSEESTSNSSAGPASSSSSGAPRSSTTPNAGVQLHREISTRFASVLMAGSVAFLLC